MASELYKSAFIFRIARNTERRGFVIAEGAMYCISCLVTVLPLSLTGCLPLDHGCGRKSVGSCASVPRIHTNLFLHACTHTHKHTHTNTHKQTQTHKHKHTQAQTHEHKQTHKHKHTETHTHTHTHATQSEFIVNANVPENTKEILNPYKNLPPRMICNQCLLPLQFVHQLTLKARW